MRLTETQERVLKKLVVKGEIRSSELPDYISLGNVVNRLNSMAGEVCIEQVGNGVFKAVNLKPFEINS